MRREIRSIDPWSAGKVGCLWGALLTAVFGCIGIFLPMLALPSLMASAAPEQSDALSIFGGGVVAAGAVYVLTILAEALILAIVLAVGAVIYNLVAKIAGGVKVDLDEK